MRVIDSEKETERKVFLPLVHSPNGRYHWCYADPKPGARYFLLVSHAGAGTQTFGPHSTALPGHSRELDWKRSNWDQNPAPIWDAGEAGRLLTK